MSNPHAYPDDIVEAAYAERRAGAKWIVLHKTYGVGIETAVRRLMARDRKRSSRAALGRVELNLPEGTAAALERVCAAAGDKAVALLSQQIHKLDQLMAGDRTAFDTWVRYGTQVGDLSKYIERIGAPVQGDDGE